jgi:hypothetical protein
MTENYEERYCLFLDILGFRSHVDESVKQAEGESGGMTFKKLMAALSNIEKGVNYKDAVEVSGRLKPTSRKVTQFSDSVVVSYLRSEPHGAGVSSIIMDVHKLQLELVSRGILLRGAVTLGLMHHDERFVLGPALNEAVAIERLAAYPRMILDGEILNEAGLRRAKKPEYYRTISSMVAEDFDGLCYIDYFNVQPDDFFDEWYEVYDYLSRLRVLVKSLARKKDPSIKVKHSWLRAKFNKIAKMLENSKFKELGVHMIPEEDQELFLEIKPF